VRKTCIFFKKSLNFSFNIHICILYMYLMFIFMHAFVTDDFPELPADSRNRGRDSVC